jgi:mannose-1-phosphate guanylyltransferase
MEKIPDIHAVAADIGWNDVGSWAVVYDLSAKDHEANVRPEHSLCLDSRGNMIVAKRSFVVTVGVQDLVIVETDDALLVCARARSQEVGKAVQALEKAGLGKLL